MLVKVPTLPSLTLAILLLFQGKAVTRRSRWLRRNSIPDALTFGVLCAVTVGALYYPAGVEMSLSLDARDILLLHFLAAIGLNTRIGTLAAGGRPLPVLLILATVFMLLQNGLGMSVAGLFGFDPRSGLMTGSIALTGGVGTILAWMPHFVESLGISNAAELGLASNMLGLVAACSIGGPIARWLLSGIASVHRVTPSSRLAPHIDRNATSSSTIGALCWRCSG